ncbi:unnamed protein product [Danaus chrysippus]|uniref:(African queen) hypothetical protein n=1 Tax=Danaus chrysippus TaxID=151541 RepID=A0A8J2QEI5_9NEOP|nr:unnamed protein product [Danaus chrysippus]
MTESGKDTSILLSRRMDVVVTLMLGLITYCQMSLVQENQSIASLEVGLEVYLSTSTFIKIRHELQNFRLSEKYSLVIFFNNIFQYFERKFEKYRSSDIKDEICERRKSRAHE